MCSRRKLQYWKGTAKHLTWVLVTSILELGHAAARWTDLLKNKVELIAVEGGLTVALCKLTTGADLENSKAQHEISDNSSIQYYPELN